MNNAELIKALRTCADHNAVGDKCYGECPYNGNYNECVDQMILDAADALEAAEQRIAELEQERNKTVTAIFGEEQKWWENRCKELETERMELTAKCRRLEAQLPKEGGWISCYDGFDYDVRCSVCGEEALIKEGGSHDHAYSHYCPNCGANMKGENDGES